MRFGKYGSIWDLFRKIFFRIRIDIPATISVLRGKAKPLYWAKSLETKNNFGDALNPIIFEYLSGYRSSHINSILNISNAPVIYFIGSILEKVNTESSIICGAGFMHANSEVKFKPKEIIAVRGPKTRNIYLRNHVDCPEVYCDPGLLVSRYFKESEFNIKKKYDVGIIVHYAHKKTIEKTEIISGNLTFKLIDIESGIMEVIEDIISCDHIISTSLHGIITAHAYNKKAIWLKIGEDLKGGDFKFLDYYNSVKIFEPKIYKCEKNTLSLERAIEYSSIAETDSLVDNFIKNFNLKIKS